MRYRELAILAVFLVSLFTIIICPVALQANGSDNKVIQINANTDDCLRYWNGSKWVWQYNSTYHTIGHQTETATKHGIGLRFINILIPNNATVTEAYITIISRSNTSNRAVRSRIYGENTDNAVTFSTETDFESRLLNRTKTTIDWDNIPVWNADAQYSSPDIKTIVQEIVKRPGWSSGNSITIFWEDFEGRSDSNRDNIDRRSYSYDANQSKTIGLHITWRTTSTVMPPEVSSKSSPDKSASATKNTTPSNIIPFIIIVALIILMMASLIYFLIRKHREHDRLFNIVSQAIKKYEPPPIRTSNERAYQYALYEYLRRDFPSIKMEPHTEDRDRPDLAIEHIGIEIKGPTGNASLENLLPKCMKYGKYYNKIIFVLFAPEYQQRKFEQVKAEIRTKYPKIVTEFIPIEIHK